MAQKPEQDSAPTDAASGPSVAHTLREFLEARWNLVKLESREASRIIALRLAALIAGAMALLFAYALLQTAVGWSLTLLIVPILPEDQAHWSGPIAAGALFIIHLVAGLALLARAKDKDNSTLFECTRAEWKKDQAWLQKKKSSEKSAS